MQSRHFGKLRKLTRGAYFRLGPNSAKELADLLGAIAVYARGGLKALQSSKKASDQKLSGQNIMTILFYILLFSVLFFGFGMAVHQHTGRHNGTLFFPFRTNCNGGDWSGADLAGARCCRASDGWIGLGMVAPDTAVWRA